MRANKEIQIDKINEKRDSRYMLHDDIVRNRDVGKVQPKYKRLKGKVIDNDYVTEKNRNIKYPSPITRD